jgi:hypothetical protein
LRTPGKLKQKGENIVSTFSTCTLKNTVELWTGVFNLSNCSIITDANTKVIDDVDSALTITGGSATLRNCAISNLSNTNTGISKALTIKGGASVTAVASAIESYNTEHPVISVKDESNFEGSLVQGLSHGPSFIRTDSASNILGNAWNIKTLGNNDIIADGGGNYTFTENVSNNGGNQTVPPTTTSSPNNYGN